MEMIADALLIAGAAGAAIYCRILAKRLGALKDLDSGLGAAIAALSRQVDELRASIEQARAASGAQTRSLTQLTARGEMAAGRLELLLAALHENGRERPIDTSPVEARRAAAEQAADPAPEAPDEDAAPFIARARRAAPRDPAAREAPARDTRWSAAP